MASLPFFAASWQRMTDEPHALLECRANDGLSHCFIQDITAVAGDPRNHWPSTCEQLQFLLRVSDVEGFANYDDVLGYLQ